jgi:hypothetical protein
MRNLRATVIIGRGERAAALEEPTQKPKPVLATAKVYPEIKPQLKTDNKHPAVMGEPAKQKTNPHAEAQAKPAELTDQKIQPLAKEQPSEWKSRIEHAGQKPREQSQEAGTEVFHTVSHTAEVAVRNTAEVGGDLEAATTGLVEGAIAGAKELGISAEDAAAAAAAGALKAAGEVSATAVETVRKAVAKPINGVKVVLKEPELVASNN